MNEVLVSESKATRLFLKLSLSRIINRFSILRRLKKAPKPGQRVGAPSRPGFGWAIGLALYALIISVITRQAIELHQRLTAAFPLESTAIFGAYFIEFSVLFFTAVIMELGSRELIKPESDFEWFSTLPVEFGVILRMRLIVGCLLNPIGTFLLGLPLLVISLKNQDGIFAIFLGVLTTLGLLTLISSVVQVGITSLRGRFKLSRLKNIQALMGLISPIAMIFSSWIATGQSRFAIEHARSIPNWVKWTPIGLVVSTLLSFKNSVAYQDLLLLWTEAIVFATLSFFVLKAQLRRGIASSTGRESGRSFKNQPRSRLSFITNSLGPIASKELKLLLRDRSLFTRVLGVPFFVLMINYFTAGKALVGKELFRNFTPTVTFGLGAYAAIFSCLSLLAFEGEGIWLLYCLPETLPRIMWKKCWFWAGVSSLLPFTFIVYSFIHGTLHLWPILPWLIAVVGVPVFMLTAASLGVLGFDPLAMQQRPRTKVSYAYLYQLLMFLYAGAIASGSNWERAVAITLSMFFCISLWQAASEKLPYLLDPAGQPRPRVLMVTGAGATVLYFIVQSIALRLTSDEIPPFESIAIATGLAGVVTFAVMRFFFWRTHTVDIPKLLLKPKLRFAFKAVIGGVACALLAFLYTKIGSHWVWLSKQLEKDSFKLSQLTYWHFIAVCMMAPIFEEFLFRGLLFKGMRRSVGAPWAILGSAFVFAIVHPPESFLPVLGVGLVAAWLYEVSGVLAVPMICHSVYNGMVLVMKSF